MGPHHYVVEAEVNAMATNARVSLYVWHPELSQQTNHWHTLKIISNICSIRHSQLPHALLNTIHTCMSVINDYGLSDCRWSNLRMSMQYIR